MVIGKGLENGFLDVDEVRTIVHEGVSALHLAGKRVLFLVPDTTRTMPMPLLFDLFSECLDNFVQLHDYLVALGTHPMLNDRQLSKLFGRSVIEGRSGNSQIFNHEWQNPECFTQLGVLPASEINQLTQGFLSVDVPVAINKHILEYDQVIICGPVFPHEVVGFSGGNKYLFPGIAGPDVINLTHWLGALITSRKIIGTKHTPVRALIDRAAELVPIPVSSFSFVVTTDGVAGVYFGKAKEAWHAASELSAMKHIIYVDKQYKRVLSIMPDLYDDLWTAAKGMYKLDPVIEDGGEVIIYAPHIHEVSYTHGKIIDQVGYHCKDFFLSQWEKYKEFPGGILAHSTHLKGLGTYDPVSGVESSRIKVTLATGISADRCRQINLEYLSPDHIRIEEWQNREQDGIMAVPYAGETLYLMKNNNDGTNREDI